MKFKPRLEKVDGAMEKVDGVTESGIYSTHVAHLLTGYAKGP